MEQNTIEQSLHKQQELKKLVARKMRNIQRKKKIVGSFFCGTYVV